MGVCHYLFWIKDKKITSVLKQGNAFEIIKFGGNSSVEYNEEFWNMWQEYAGFIKTDFIDFCFVYDDEMPHISDYLKSRECSIEECIWNRYLIQDTVNLLEIKYPTEIVNENGICIARTGTFINKKQDDVIRLTASYRSSQAVILKDEPKGARRTEFIDEMMEKLKEYDEGN